MKIILISDDKSRSVSYFVLSLLLIFQLYILIDDQMYVLFLTDILLWGMKSAAPEHPESGSFEPSVNKTDVSTKCR